MSSQSLAKQAPTAPGDEHADMLRRWTKVLRLANVPLTVFDKRPLNALETAMMSKDGKAIKDCAGQSIHIASRTYLAAILMGCTSYLTILLQVAHEQTNPASHGLLDMEIYFALIAAVKLNSLSHVRLLADHLMTYQNCDFNLMVHHGYCYGEPHPEYSSPVDSACGDGNLPVLELLYLCKPCTYYTTHQGRNKSLKRVVEGSLDKDANKKEYDRTIEWLCATAAEQYPLHSQRYYEYRAQCGEAVQTLVTHVIENNNSLGTLECLLGCCTKHGIKVQSEISAALRCTLQKSFPGNIQLLQVLQKYGAYIDGILHHAARYTDTPSEVLAWVLHLPGADLNTTDDINRDPRNGEPHRKKTAFELAIVYSNHNVAMQLLVAHTRRGSEIACDETVFAGWCQCVMRDSNITVLTWMLEVCPNFLNEATYSTISDMLVTKNKPDETQLQAYYYKFLCSQQHATVQRGNYSLGYDWLDSWSTMADEKKEFFFTALESDRVQAIACYYKFLCLRHATVECGIYPFGLDWLKEWETIDEGGKNVILEAVKSANEQRLYQIAGRALVSDHLHTNEAGLVSQYLS
jgi:hypothetical protein